jgi:1-acyl-sn-glycerol-3-phosphate acyltransferase
VGDAEWLRGPLGSAAREVVQQGLLFPATRWAASPRIVGADDLAHAPQPAILAPNHESDIDTPLVLLSLPHAWRSRTVVGAASDRFYRKRGYAIASGFWINTFPFDRGGGQRRGLAAAAAHLRDGRNVLLFPQGTRGAGPEGYRAGVAELALTAGAPIIPIHIEGTALVMPKGRGLNRRAQTRVTFARPLHPRPGETPDQLTHRLHDAIEPEH